MKQEDIEKAAREYANGCRNRHHNCEPFCIVDFIEGAKWQAKQSPWISVEERLPKLKERVLVAHRGIDRIIICIMKRIPHDSSNPSNPKWHWSLANNKEDVIAWMTIPSFDGILETNRDVLE